MKLTLANESEYNNYVTAVDRGVVVWRKRERAGWGRSNW
jgi:hypothetical protein